VFEVLEQSDLPQREAGDAFVLLVSSLRLLRTAASRYVHTNHRDLLERDLLASGPDHAFVHFGQ
jgi:hypothetical protein